MRDYMVGLKTLVRETVHDVMASSAEYSFTAPGASIPETASLGVRFHTKIQKFGDMTETGYAEFIEGVTRLVFHRGELQAQQVTLKENGFVTLLAPEWRGAKFRLETKEPFEGPVEEVWHVTFAR